MSGWDTPPTADELQASGWDTPPTAAEMAAVKPRIGMGDVKVKTEQGRAYTGMGDVNASPTAFAGTGNVPVSWLTGDPATDAQIAQSLARQGYRRDLTKSDALKAGAVSLGVVAPELVPGLLGVTAGGGLLGAGMSEQDSASGKALDAAKSAAGAYVLGKAIPYVAQGVKYAGKALLRAVTPKVVPTPEAARLLEQGVPLTTGQLQPSSMVNVVEQATDRAPLGVGAQRDAAVDVWRNLPIREALAPGQAPPAGGIPEQLETVYQGFRPQYAPIRNVQLPPGATAGMPEAALQSPRAIDARTKAAAANEIRNALTVLGEAPKPVPSGLVDPKGVPFPAAPVESPPTSVGDLMKVRENIREQLRAATKAQDWDKVRILGHAQDTVTETINAGLSPVQREALAAADARYHRFNVVEDAANRAGLTGEFSPKQLGAAIKSDEGRRAFTQGGGGALRQLADDANAVFSATIPPTGKVPLLVSGIPKPLVAPLARAAQFPTVRAAMLRQPISMTPAGPVATGAGQNTARVISPQLQAYLDAMVPRGRFGLTPVMADDQGSN